MLDLRFNGQKEAQKEKNISFGGFVCYLFIDCINQYSPFINLEIIFSLVNIKNNFE